MAEFGYAGEILKVDLSGRQTTKLLTANYADRFLGGRGIAAKIYWDETGPDTGAFDPENCLVYITGPLAGFTRFAGCRWQICGKSPLMAPEAFSYANLGGSWGAWLKYAGYDGLVVTGRADQPVYIYIDNGKVTIRDASHLWGKTTVETQGILQSELGKETRVLTIGPAAEHKVVFATVLAAENASGSSGFGAVMGSKNLKAVVVKADEKQRPVAANPERLKNLAKEVYELRTTNFEDYGHILPLKIRFTACYGCISGCTRGTYEAENGYQFKSLCQASGVYMGPAMKYYGARSEGARDATGLGSRLCDILGLDTAVLAPMIGWLGQCYDKGILSDQETGLSLSKIGSVEFIDDLTRKISYREGFGDILAHGTLKAAEYVGKGSQKLISTGIITRGSETRDYDPRLFLANALIYATEPRRAIHLLHAQSLPLSRWNNWRNGFKDAFLTTEFMQDIADKLWGGGHARDFNTYEGKALVSRKIQEYGYIKESLILCDLAWPIYQVHSSDKNYPLFTLEGQIVSAITGRELGAAELIVIADRIFNMQRAVLMRQGWGGREGDNLMGYLFEEPFPFIFFDPQSRVPGPDGEPVSRKGAILDEDEFEKLKDEFYTLRGWDVASGLQTRAGLEKLQLGDIASDLEKRGLLT